MGADGTVPDDRANEKHGAHTEHIVSKITPIPLTVDEIMQLKLCKIKDKMTHDSLESLQRRKP